MENKVICKDFYLVIGKFKVNHDDGRRACDTCYYPEEFEINTTLKAVSDEGEEISYLIVN